MHAGSSILRSAEGARFDLRQKYEVHQTVSFPNSIDITQLQIIAPTQILLSIAPRRATTRWTSAWQLVARKLLRN